MIMQRSASRETGMCGPQEKAVSGQTAAASTAAARSASARTAAARTASARTASARTAKVQSGATHAVLLKGTPEDRWRPFWWFLLIIGVIATLYPVAEAGLGWWRQRDLRHGWTRTVAAQRAVANAGMTASLAARANPGTK